MYQQYRQLVRWSLMLLLIVLFPQLTVEQSTLADFSLSSSHLFNDSYSTQSTQMRHQPGRQANKMADFRTMKSRESQANGGLGVAQILSLHEGDDHLLRFNQDRVNLFVEANTFPRGTRIHFTELEPETPDQQRRFRIEARQGGREQHQFDQPVRLIFDIRGLVAERFSLMYQDETNPTIWHHVPTTLHDGYVSAEVTHFSSWVLNANGNGDDEGWEPTWNPPTVSGFSGAAAYSYPIPVPVGRRGLQPNLSLNYSSRGVDGHILKAGRSVLGTGWSLGGTISIVREKAFTDNERTNSHHQAIHEATMRLIWHGAGHRLYPATNPSGNGPIRYYAQDAPGLHIERFYDANETNTDGLYWIIHAPDGTRYELGTTADSQETHTVSPNDHNNYLVVDDHEGHNDKTSALAWHVTLVRDTVGNELHYRYATDTDQRDNIPGPNGSTWSLTTHRTRLWQIDYNFDSNGNAGSRVELRSAGDDQLELPEDRISHIYLYQADLSLPQTEIRLTLGNSTIDSVGCLKEGSSNPTDPWTTTTDTLSKIQVWVNTDNNPNSDEDENGTGVYSLPPVTFSHQEKAHFFQNGDPCFQYTYLHSMNNGYGGVVTYTYTSDNRAPGVYNYDSKEGYTFPFFGLSYYVTQLEQDDGQGNVGVTTYNLQNPCYNQNNTSVDRCKWPGTDHIEHGPLVGFQSNTETMLGSNGQALVERITTYHRADNLPALGKPAQTDVYIPDEGGSLVLVQQNLINYTTETYVTAYGPEGVTFTYTGDHEHIEKDGTHSLSVKTVYQYDSSYQGGTQYGNLTHTTLYEDDILVQSTERRYEPDPVDWLVNYPSREDVFDETGQLHHATLTYYDGGSDWYMSPRNGKVTRVRQLAPMACSAYQPPQAGCNAAFQTIDVTSQYNSLGLPTHQTIYTDYGYVALDNNDALLHSVDPSQGQTSETVYDSTWTLYPVQQINAAGHSVTYDYTGHSPFGRQNGRVSRLTDNATGLITQYEYDPFGRLFAVYRGHSQQTPDRGILSDPWDGDALTRYRYYDNSWNGVGIWGITTETRPAYFNGNDRWLISDMSTLNYYDGFGRVYQSRHRAANVDVSGVDQVKDLATVTSYNELGQVSCTSMPQDIPSDDTTFMGKCENLLNSTTMSYDGLGRLINTYTPDGNRLHQHYGIIKVGSEPARAYHDTVDANGHWRQQRFDGRGQLTRVYELSGSCGDMFPGYSCPPGEPEWAIVSYTDYAYDLLGNLETVSRRDNMGVLLSQMSMVYDSFGRKETMVDADMGSWSYGYDATGNLEWQRAAGEEALCLYYDELNRLEGKMFGINGDCYEQLPAPYPPSSDVLVHYDYQNLTGRLNAVYWQGYTRSDNFSYDEWGRISRHKRSLDDRNYTIETFSFDVLDRPLRQRLPDGEIMVHSYDREGQNGLTPEGQTPLISDIRYNKRGQLRQLVRPTAPNTNYIYHGASQMFRLNTLSAGSLIDFAYDYDAVGNLIMITAPIDSQTFQYDYLNRLTQATGTQPAYSRTYDYDLLGNFEQIEVDGETRVYAYDGSSPHAVTSISSSAMTQQFVYDGQGNMTARHDETGQYDQGFDDQNRLVRVTDEQTNRVTRFEYDVDGIRTITRRPDGATVYTPFPLYEETVWQTPVVTLTVDTALVVSGGSVTFSWDSRAAYCLGDWGSGELPPAGEIAVTAPTLSGNYLYTLTCYNEAGSSSDDVTIEVAGVTVDLNHGTPLAFPNDAIDLNWGSQNATSCTASGAWSGNKATNGNESVAAPGGGWTIGNHTFHLSCSNGSNSEMDSSTVTVRDPLLAPYYLQGEVIELCSGSGNCNPIVHLTWKMGQLPADSSFTVYRSSITPVPLDAFHRVASGLSQPFYFESYNQASYYVVTVVNSYGESQPSNTVFVDSVDPCPIECQPYKMPSSHNTTGAVAIQRSSYSAAGQMVAQRQQAVALTDDFEDGNADEWTTHNGGNWVVTGNAYQQTELGNGVRYTNRPLAQRGRMVYEWDMTFHENEGDGALYFFASRGDVHYHGESYILIQSIANLLLYKYDEGGVYTLLVHGPASRAVSTAYHYRLIFDADTGEVNAWRDDEHIFSWTDSTPYEQGNFLGIRTQHTSVTFDNFQVTGDEKVLLHDTFADDADDWTPFDGTWTWTNGSYQQSNDAVSGRTSLPLEQRGDMVYRWQMTFESGGRYGRLYFMASEMAYPHPASGYFVQQKPGHLYLYKIIDNGNNATTLTHATLAATNGSSYNYQVTYNEGQIRVWRDGVPILAATDNDPITQASYIGLRATYSVVNFDNITVSHNGGLRYLYNDHLGSVTAVSDLTGQQIGKTTTYLPFGSYRTRANGTTDRGYTGHKHNDNLGLIYMNARYYVPGIGRFASADTIVPDPTNPQSFNRYIYVLNNPLRLIDPSGHFEVEAIYDYILNNECGGSPICADDTLEIWSQNEEWWNLLRTAQEGDILFGVYGAFSTVSNGGFAFSFTGQGTTELAGIALSDMFGIGANLELPNGGSLKLSDILRGQYSVENALLSSGEQIVRMNWGGIVRTLESGDHFIFARQINWDESFVYTEFMEARDTLIIGTTTSVLASATVAWLGPATMPVWTSWVAGGVVGTGMGMGSSAFWQNEGRVAGDIYIDVGTNRFVVRPGLNNQIVGFD